VSGMSSSTKPRDNGNRIILGYIIGETSHSKVTFTATEPPRVGEYVLVSYAGNGRPERLALAMVEASFIGNPLLSIEEVKPEFVSKAQAYGGEMVEYNIGRARILSWADTLAESGVVETPTYPPRPGAPVYRADADVLKKIFAREGGGRVRIGVLVNHRDVPVSVDVNAIVSRHLAILAITGAGKSNTVGVLVDRIVNDLGGTIVLFDMHNEYGEVAGENTHFVEAKIHPARLTLHELFRLLHLDEKAHVQRRFLRQAYRSAENTRYQKPEEFLKEIMEELENLSEKKTSKKSTVSEVLEKLEDLLEEYWERVITPNAPISLEEAIVPGKANIFKLGGVSEEVADVVVHHYLNWLLAERKEYVASSRKGEGKVKGYPVPVLTIIEEAHILLPGDRSTMTKSIAGKIAREGRKFGVGLCLVSQRPKKLDEDSLSQTNNKIILRLVEPGDQKYVQSASETLSDELLELLPSLNVGEAILLGMMTPVPAIVKIDKSTRKIGGGDIVVHEEWKRYVEMGRKLSEEASKYIMMPDE